MFLEGAAHDLYRALMWAGSWWCHQLPERSPFILGAQLPLCWRCTGILIGTVVLFVWLLARKRLPPVLLSLALALLLPLDVLQTALSGGQGDNTRRLLTGLLWGIFGTSLALHLLKRAVAWRSTTHTPAPT